MFQEFSFREGVYTAVKLSPFQIISATNAPLKTAEYPKASAFTVTADVAAVTNPDVSFVT